MDGHMLSILTVNIGAAARPRAQLLLAWLAGRPEDVFVLTETSSGPGTAYLLDRFREAGYTVVHTPDADGERGSALVSRVDIAAPLDVAFAQVSVPGRVAAAVLDTTPAVAILGVYVPSRDRSTTKIGKKQAFVSSLLAALDELPEDLRGRLVMGGDYNVIARSHRPVYPGFLPLEFDLLEQLATYGLVDAHEHCSSGEQMYSWVGRTGDGYRYDYFHVGRELVPAIAGCAYLHETRERLTDHAAVTLTLSTVAAGRIPVTDPAAEISTLF
jgi:exodeoxyribonuclease-3